jgi:hypothetical protein
MTFEGGSASSVSDLINVAEGALATKSVVAFEYNGDTYVVAANAANQHTVVELAGVTGVTGLAMDGTTGHITLSTGGQSIPGA